MASPNQITISKLLRLIGTRDCPVLLDVCIDEDFNEDPRLIPSARRIPFHAIGNVVSEVRDKKVVVICQKGLKLSAGASALLRADGVDAEYLEGGLLAWRAASAPLVPFNAIPDNSDHGGTLWVTRHRPKIDRIACPWLIRRFVDRQARFLFVEPSQVELVAEKFGATAFDIENTFWGHRRDGCTFDTMIGEFSLNTEPLKRMAEIIRAADTGNLDAVSEAAGVSALLLGLSRMFKDDLPQLEAGVLLFDALYLWCRDAIDETHSSMRQR
ncbi:MAG: sulfurtransferase/chromate resistance protein [Rhizobiaceae bacterium]|nr:sulfurtransferase/chromate resistance protein [Rhizobiaceae bacterium]